MATTNDQTNQEQALGLLQSHPGLQVHRLADDDRHCRCCERSDKSGVVQLMGWEPS
jgi:hypothetical protein